MTELTRRQMRELERNGGIAAPVVVTEQVSTTPQPRETPVALQEAPAVAPADSGIITSRRQLREANVQLTQAPISVQSSPEVQNAEVEPSVATVKDYEVPVPLLPRRLAPVPPVGSRRAMRSAPVVPVSQEPVALEAVEVEIPEAGFVGANYLGEPSTQSIMLDVAPEAIALPLDTGEVFTTGSIAILPEAPGPTTGGLDGAEVENIEEAVTGVLSIVDPVSAKTLIDERSVLGVVPEGVLRKGWWRPWLVGLVSVVMAIAAILASITILNALGE